MENEIYRAQRYSQNFALIAFGGLSENSSILKKINTKFIRKSDYFGKLNSQYYAILLTHTSLDEAFILSEKSQLLSICKEIRKRFYMINFLMALKSIKNLILNYKESVNGF